MYQLIQENTREVLLHISHKHISTYDWLIQHSHQPQDTNFQTLFRIFWGMNAARLGSPYYAKYFTLLQVAMSTEIELETVVRQLYEVPVNKREQKALQFSFATKLLHTRFPNLPIYDRQVADFYFFNPPSSDSKAFDERIHQLMGFYKFLETEYARVLDLGLLEKSIAGFRAYFQPKQFTDQKIIDSLIWGFVSLLKRGEVTQGRIRYV
ncbi:MAG: hypothetical protein OT477_00120 [Chloroflexi bacterium]|nr:hypothetical protein [Chloroflexota bacterium]